jgi:hypothetical protein
MPRPAVSHVSRALARHPIVCSKDSDGNGGLAWQRAVYRPRLLPHYSGRAQFASGIRWLLRLVALATETVPLRHHDQTASPDALPRARQIAR